LLYNTEADYADVLNDWYQLLFPADLVIKFIADQVFVVLSHYEVVQINQ